MACNWELFELRLRVWLTSRTTSTGKFQGLNGLEFFNVTVDLRDLGLKDFEGSGHVCNFAYVFGELAKLKIIPVSFSSKAVKTDTSHYDPMPSFGVMQQLEKSGKTVPAALLYVHRRNGSEVTSLEAGTGLWMNGVKVMLTSNAQDYYIQLMGESAKVVNP
jgi:hypothetical protein